MDFLSCAVGGGDTRQRWSSESKDGVFFLCWCRVLWSAPSIGGGGQWRTQNKNYRSVVGGLGSPGADALCGGGCFGILGDGLGAPSAATPCGTPEAPSAVVSCDGLGALGAPALCGGGGPNCCSPATVQTLCGTSFLQSEGYFFVGSLLLFVCRTLLQYYESIANIGLLQRQVLSQHLISPVMLTNCSSKFYFLLFQNDSILARSTVQVEQTLLLRSNDRIRRTNLLSPHQTFDLYRFRGDSCRSLPDCQATSMSMEAKEICFLRLVSLYPVRDGLLP
uniref:DUF3778 domain-containing protein n=1 Tax=Oryza rufipogon TaxID=4529 RepID=A0A0E0MYH3_ORYRU